MGLIHKHNNFFLPCDKGEIQGEKLINCGFLFKEISYHFARESEHIHPAVEMNRSSD